MKLVFLVLTLTLTIALSSAVRGEDAKTTAYTSGETAQGTGTANKKQLLEVAVPSSAIVRLKQGGSYTGKLTAFNSRNLAITAGGASETVPVSQIKAVKFQGDVWIDTPEGTRRRLPIRGITIPLEGVPLSAFNLGNSPQTARLNLETVLTQEEFKKLSRRTDRVYVVKKILFDSSDKMTIRIVGTRASI